jgi:hypothetical protein
MSRRQVTSIPSGRITAETELVFVDEIAFVNAAKHEEVVARHVAEAERLGEANARLLEMIAIRKPDPSRAHQIPYDASRHAGERYGPLLPYSFRWTDDAGTEAVIYNDYLWLDAKPDLTRDDGTVAICVNLAKLVEHMRDARIRPLR